ncbi:MAG: hypothetical protein AB8E82_13860 [Aureispira sp.]
MKTLYTWHYRLGLLVTIPILGWCISGLTHPIMANFFKIRPAQRTVEVQAPAVDSTAPNLKNILDRQHRQGFKQIRWITYKDEPYYQIIQDKKEALYFHQQTGKFLEDGDKGYAESLARYFLGDFSSTIVGVERVDAFTQEYRFINRLLPVYKVRFARSDGMEVYVSTESSRLGTMNDNWRKQSMALFAALHNWTFLQNWPVLKLSLMLLFMLAGFLAAGSGLLIYGVFWNQLNAQRLDAGTRRWHRRLGLLVALSTLGFTFSGGYHALAKVQEKPLRTVPAPLYTAEDLTLLPILKAKFADRPVGNVSLVKLEGQTFFQVQWLLQQEPAAYFNTKNLERISQGDERYALAQSKLYTQLPDSEVINTEEIVKFGGEYGFINKRLPVRKINYKTPQNHAVYVEPSTGKIAAVIEDSKRAEAFSFLMLHKYHFLNTPLGKKGRDVVLVSLILMIMLVHILGVLLWRKRK